MGNATGQDPITVLSKLKDMLDSRMVDQAEYDRRKQQLLDRMVADDTDEGNASKSAASGTQGGGTIVKTGRVWLLAKPSEDELDPCPGPPGAVKRP